MRHAHLLLLGMLALSDAWGGVSPTPEPAASEYHSTGTNVNVCPDLYSKITSPTMDSCSIAASALGIRPEDTKIASASGVPSGCTYNSAKKMLWMNTAKGGDAHQNFMVLCRADPTDSPTVAGQTLSPTKSPTASPTASPDYTMMPLGVNVCPTGTLAITGAGECHFAGQKLRDLLQVRWQAVHGNPRAPGTTPFQPRGCIYDTTPHESFGIPAILIFNTNAVDPQPVVQTTSIICKGTPDDPVDPAPVLYSETLNDVNACPAGTTVLTLASECLRAATALGIDAGDFGTTSMENERPTGCFVNSANNQVKVRWNTDTTNTADTYTKLICIATPAGATAQAAAPAGAGPSSVTFEECTVEL